ncbi:MAG: archaeosortase/exosortase family protein [Oscillatoriales cyanobacterium SM2_2_1]|nr:archaeosortase/exosortase family protein [Oscillatoriales cyanobacterium SM2_2_1]
MNGITWGKLRQHSGAGLLTLLAVLAAMHTTLVWRLSNDWDETGIHGLTWAVAFLLLWRQRYLLPTWEQGQVSFGSWLSGILLLAWTLFKCLTARRYEDVLFIQVPLAAMLGGLLTQVGWRKLGPFWSIMALIATLGVPIPLVSAAIERVIPVNLFTAQFANSVLYYGGQRVVQTGLYIASPQGQVLVGRGCAGLPPIFLLLRLTLMYILAFPVARWTGWLLAGVAIAVAFVVNSVRVAILVLVVRDDVAFDYWHDGDGSQIFSAIAVTLFFACCHWLTREGEEEEDLESDAELDGEENAS